jgi:hypothetical protein
VGTGSCASTACHQGSGPRGSVGSEYTTWITSRDKHARAYEVLFNPKSKTIIRNLNRGGEEAPRFKPAHDEPFCLNCHVLPAYKQAKLGPRFSREDGVGCESCHGPAERWLSEHYRPEWRQKTITEKIDLGFWDTKSVLGRARGCVDCHVGAPGIDVNHDLIAAGHPRLNFEFGAYHALMPRHWDAQKDRAAYADLEARIWAVGQVVSAEAALNLLTWRAEEAERDPKRQPWPEFAEYDCFACHHGLRAKSWRQDKKHYGKRRPGALTWGNWYTALLPEAAGASTEMDTAKIRKAMEMPYPDRLTVRDAAKSLRNRLDVWPERLARQPPAEARDLLLRLKRLARQEGRRVESWDEATQLYLALAAHHHAVSDLGGRAALLPEWRGLLRELANPLQFPQGFDSPKSVDEGRGAEAVRARLEQLKRLGSR